MNYKRAFIAVMLMSSLAEASLIDYCKVQLVNIRNYLSLQYEGSEEAEPTPTLLNGFLLGELGSSLREEISAVQRIVAPHTKALKKLDTKERKALIKSGKVFDANYVTLRELKDRLGLAWYKISSLDAKQSNYQMFIDTLKEFDIQISETEMLSSSHTPTAETNAVMQMVLTQALQSSMELATLETQTAQLASSTIGLMLSAQEPVQAFRAIQRGEPKLGGVPNLPKIINKESLDKAVKFLSQLQAADVAAQKSKN